MRRDEPTPRPLVLTAVLALSGVLALTLPQVTTAQATSPDRNEERSDASSEGSETAGTGDEDATTTARPDGTSGETGLAPVVTASPDGDGETRGAGERDEVPTTADAPNDQGAEGRDRSERARSDGEARHPDAAILRRNRESSVSASAALGIATVGSGIVFASVLGFFLDRVGAIDRCNALERADEVRRGCVNLASIQTQSELALGSLLGTSGVLAAVGVAWLLTVVLDGEADGDGATDMTGAERTAASADAAGVPSY